MTRSPEDAVAPYWPRYCEENVWHRCAALAERGEEAWALVVSNRARRVAFLRQRAGRPPDGLIGWDYHVVTVIRDGGHPVIVDPDSALPSPCDAERYLRESFPVLPERLAGWRPRFRLVDAVTYRDGLASDRRHMRDAAGRWLAPPPPWPCIGSGHLLDRLIDVDDPFVGERLDEAALRARLGIARRDAGAADRAPGRHRRPESEEEGPR